MDLGEGAPAVNGIPPLGFVNNTTSLFPTIHIGNYGLSVSPVSQAGLDPIPLAFTLPSSWTDGSWSADVSGQLWTCNTTGVYQFTVSIAYTLFNVAETENPVVTLYAEQISATTTELNNIFVNSIPQPITTTATGQQMSLTAIVNADAGSTLQFFILDESGNMTLAVGSAVFGNTAGTMTWQLLAQGPVGNIGTV